MRNFPPQDRKTQRLQTLGNGGKIVACRPDAACNQAGQGKVFLLYEMRPARRAQGKTNRLCPASRRSPEALCCTPLRREATTPHPDKKPPDCSSSRPSQARCRDLSWSPQVFCPVRRIGAGGLLPKGRSSTALVRPPSCPCAVFAGAGRRRSRDGARDRRNRARAIRCRAIRRSAVPLVESDSPGCVVHASISRNASIRPCTRFERCSGPIRRADRRRFPAPARDSIFSSAAIRHATDRTRRIDGRRSLGLVARKARGRANRKARCRAGERRPE